MNLYPLKFTPICKEKVWGGRRLKSVCGRALPEGSRIGESWVISDHGDDVSMVEGGAWAGRSLRELIAEKPREILGGALAARRPHGFPLLIKLIDASAHLSVQVHPPDDYAAEHEAGEQGKTELWYLMQADEPAELICGFCKTVDRESVARALEKGALLDLLTRISVRAGDAIFVPSGRIHSIGAGTLILEIGENSDVTYRLYDWDRSGPEGGGRPLHLEKGLAVIDFRDRSEPRISKKWESGDGFRKAHLVNCRHFRTTQFEISGGWSSARAGDRFSIISIVGGSGILEYGDSGERITLAGGDSILLPAMLGSYRVCAGAGGCNLLETEVP